MKRNFWLVLVLLLALPALVFGQAQTTGRITGRVTDDQGAPIVGATVTINNQELQLERTATTGPNGEFLFALLPVGPYTATVTADGRQPEVYSFRLGVGETVPVNAQLAPGEVVAEEITVTGVATALETTTVGDNFDYENEVEALPIRNRDIEEVATLSPNISFGPTAGTISISGAPSFDTSVLLDGAEVSDPYFGSAPTVWLEDAVEEVQVLTSGVSARYGRFQGGIINAITKSGSNEFEGTLRGEFANQDWNSATPYSRQILLDDIEETYQATLGGYIVRDRLWFFAGARTIPDTASARNTLFTGEGYTRTDAEDRWQGKLRGAISSNHLVDLSYLSFESSVTGYGGLPVGDDRALGVREDPRETWTLAYQGVLGANTFLEVQGTRKDVEIVAGGDPSRGDPFYDLARNAVFNNHWWDANDPSTRDNQTAAVNLTHSLGTENLGSHTLEAGVQYVESTTGGENKQSPTDFNLLTVNPDFFAGLGPDGEPRFNLRRFNGFRWEALELGGDQTLENTALYLQDGWTWNNWRFDLGVRYDQYDGSGPLPQFQLDFNDIAPRLGVTYSITPTLQAQATYGKYVSRFNDNVANNVTGVSGAPRIETVYTGPTLLGLTGQQVQDILRNDANWLIVTDFVSPDQPTSVLADDINAPYADDFTLSLRSALPRNSGSVILSYIDREYNDLIDDFAGAACSEQGFCEQGDVTTVSLGGVPFADIDTTVWANNPNARRDYQALTTVWDVRPSTRWQFTGNYTYAETKANYEGEGQNTPSSGSPLGDYPRAVFSQGAASPFGWTDDDIRHRAIAMGAYTFDFNRWGALSLGSIFTYQSGRPFNLTAAVPLRDVDDYVNDFGSTYTHFFGRNGELVANPERGPRRFNDWWSWDLSARYEFPIFRDFNTFLKVAVTNVLNNDEVITFATTGRAVYRDPANPSPDTLIGWAPSGTCGLGSEPSESCTGFGRIRNQNDFQTARTFLVTLALDF